MLQPKRTKYRKVQKGRMKGNSGRGTILSNGMYGIKSLDSNFLTSRQIEAARIAATRFMKREGQLWIKIFPDKPITKKPDLPCFLDNPTKGDNSLLPYTSPFIIHTFIPNLP